MNAVRLGGSARQAMAPQYRAEQALWVGEFGPSSACGLGSDNLAVVSRIAAKQRVGALQIAAERQIGGRLYEDGDSIIEPGLANSRIDD